MVRLGPASYITTQKVTATFNPTVVRLGLARSKKLQILDPVAFNPTVVRLGPLPLSKTRTTGKPFNPTVVRLGRVPRGLRAGAPQVLSIPLWCDWDVVGEGATGAGASFQSHCGAIGTLV